VVLSDVENDNEKGSDVQMETVSNASKLEQPAGIEDEDYFRFTFGKFMACWVSTSTHLK
jgi:hypothetical protein